jgi:hypothetical protein
MRKAPVARSDVENSEARPGTDAKMMIQKIYFRDRVEQVARDVLVSNPEGEIPEVGVLAESAEKSEAIDRSQIVEAKGICKYVGIGTVDLPDPPIIATKIGQVLFAHVAVFPYGWGGYPSVKRTVSLLKVKKLGIVGPEIALCIFG